MFLCCAVLIAFAFCVLELPGYPAPRKIDAFSKVPLIKAFSYYHDNRSSLSMLETSNFPITGLLILNNGLLVPILATDVVTYKCLFWKI